MPRHPPCALHSLSHKHNTTTTTTKTRTNTHTQPHPPPIKDRQATRPNAYGHQCKMLASTMQISNNKPTNTSHHTCVRHRPRRPEDSTPPHRTQSGFHRIDPARGGA